jgi:REP element-mobilizing transposase RayT
MPKPGMRWRLITFNTLGTWLHGDLRGFRSREHRIHSSGDYRNPPPAGEHSGLLRYQRATSRAPVHLPRALRPVIGASVMQSFKDDGFQVLAISVVSDHVHVVVELPDDVKEVKRIVGQAKRRSSRAIKEQIDGSVWSSGCDYTPKDDRESLAEAVLYVRDRQGEGSWTWSFRDREGAFR